MGTLLQWRAAIGGFCLKIGSTKWRPTCASRTRTQTKKKIQFLQDVDASTSIKSEGKEVWKLLCLVLIELFGLKYLQKCIEGINSKICNPCGNIANGTAFWFHKSASVFSLFLACVDKMGVRIFIPTPKHYVVLPVKELSISMVTSFAKLVTNFQRSVCSISIKCIITLLALIFYLPIMVGRLLRYLTMATTKRIRKMNDKTKCIACLCLCLSISLWSKPNQHNEEHETGMPNPTRGFDCDGVVSVAAKVIQMCLMISGDVELNPGPRVGGNCCANSLGFCTFGSVLSYDAKKYLKHSCVWKNFNFKWSSSQKMTDQIDKALVHFSQGEYNNFLDGTSKLTLFPDVCMASPQKTLFSWSELFKGTDQRYTDVREMKRELMMFYELVIFFSQRKATIIQPCKGISKIYQDGQVIPTMDFTDMKNKINGDLLDMFGSAQKTYKLDDIIHIHEHENNKERREKLEELIYITQNILLDNKINASEWLMARELRKTTYSSPKEVNFLVFSSEIKMVFVFEVRSNTKNVSEKSLDHIAWNKECFENVYGHKLSKEWNICVTLVLPNVNKLPTSATCNNCKDFIRTNDVDFPKWMDNIISSRKNNDLDSFIPSYDNDVIYIFIGKIVRLRSIHQLRWIMKTTDLCKSITRALSVVTLRGIGVFRFFIIMTACFSIVSCQISHPSDSYVSLTTGFQVSKDKPKNSTITLPSNMKNSCQLGLIISIKSEQSHSEEEHLNETGNLIFSVSHPNLPESQEEFWISSNEVDFRRKRILHNLCFTNCENIQERSVFLKATTDIARVIKNITVTSVRGGDPCTENEKASSDPWKIPAIISIIIAFLVCLFAIILVLKVLAKKSSFEALPTDVRQQKDFLLSEMVEIKLPVS